MASIEVTAKTLYTFSTCLKLQLARLTGVEVWILLQALWANRFVAFNALSVEINLYGFFKPTSRYLISIAFELLIEMTPRRSSLIVSGRTTRIDS